MQTQYNEKMGIGLEGQLHDLKFHDVMSFINDTEKVYFGKLVVLGAGDDKCKLPAAAGDITDAKKALGVALHTHAVEQQEDGDDANYKIGSAVSVAKKARVNVIAENAVTAGVSDVHVRYAGVGKKGAFRGAAVAGETAVLAGAKWITSTTAAGELAVLEIDL